MKTIERKIVVLGTGGTIAGTASSPAESLGYTAARLGVADLLAGLPVLRDAAIVTEQVAQVDSKDMGPDIWRYLAMRCAHWLAQLDVAGVVITHGTDTLEETAFFLHRVLAPEKPVVFTSAMRPATALSADGPQNMVDAVTVALHPGARGVVAVGAGTIHSAEDVRKAHSWRLDAFDSGDAGPIGYVEAGRLRLLRPWPDDGESVRGAAYAALSRVALGGAWPRVEIVMSHAGADGALVRMLIAKGVQGIVAAGTGNGSLAQDLEASLIEARECGIAVVRTTRCASGSVLEQASDVLPASRGLSAMKARVAMQLELLQQLT